MGNAKQLLQTAVIALAVLGLSCTGISEEKGDIFTSAGVTASPDSNANVPGYYGGVVTWDQADPQLVEISSTPQAEMHLGNGKMTLSMAQIPFVTPQDFGTARGTSELALGAEFYTAKRVAASEVLGFTFSPGDGEPAYACYELQAPADTPFTVGIAWHSLPEDMDSYFVGIGDPQMNSWHWYNGPNDGVLTFDPADWSTPGEIGETAYICVAMQDGKPADFWQLRWGVQEVRGTGLEMNEATASAPQKDFSKSASAALPPVFSLKSYIPPISDQGGMGSCTAFAVNDAAFNGLLAQLYEADGWDVASDLNRTSPMWSYIKSGYPPIGDWDPPCGSAGRYMNQAFNVLIELGTATQESVPYYTTFNCTNEFSDTANFEAPLLTVDDWYSIGGGRDFLVENIKRSLAEDGRPVPIAMYGLEPQFLSYNGGVYHFSGTPGTTGGHAMCIVGYDDSLGAFEVRNSWGRHWGLDGYWWCGYDAVEDMYLAGGRFYAYSMTASYNQDVPAHFFGAAPVYDETEPNDSIQAAQALPEFDFHNFTGQVGDGNDQADYYSFTFSEGDLNEFILTHTDPGAAVTLELYSSDGELIARSVGGAGTEELAGYWGDSGQACLAVAGDGAPVDYNLTGVVKHPPPPPGNLKASQGQHDDRIFLSWDQISQCGYIVYQATSPDGPYEELVTLYVNRYSDFSPAILTPYWYQVRAVNTEAQGILCAPVSGYRAATAPTGVTASDQEFADRVEISWDGIESAPGYVVKRSMLATGPFSTIGHFPEPAAVDLAVEAHATYHYVVCVANGELEGPPSEPDAGSLESGPLNPGEQVVDDPGDELIEPGDGEQSPQGNHSVTPGEGNGNTMEGMSAIGQG